MAKTKKISPGTMVKNPSQSILTSIECRSCLSEGTVTKATVLMKKSIAEPIQKYHPHGRYSPLTPPTKMPEKNPIGEHAP